MRKSNQIRIYLVEGDTEYKYLECLQKSDLISDGKIYKFNCWDRPASKLLRRLPKSGKIHLQIIFDTDNLANKASFITTVKELAKHVEIVILSQQTYNFEDELEYACDKVSNKAQLYKHFDAVNADEFKSKFLSVNNLLTKLESCQLKQNKMWVRNIHSQIEQGLKHLKNIKM